MNNKGFMMAEVIVVAAIILVTMVGLYASYNKVFAVYNQRVDYYDVVTLYELGDIRKSSSYELYDEVMSDYFYPLSGEKKPLIESDNKLVYYTDVNSLSEMSENNELDISLTFRDHLKFLYTSIETDVEKILVMERCLDDEKNNCKYAYLEVFDA